MSKKVETICMVGCGGFIGSHLVKRFLVDGNYKICGIDIDDRKIKQFLGHERFSYHNVDIKDSEKLRQYVEKSDCVISLAALCNPALYNKIPLEVVEINFLHSLELVKMCHKYKKWLVHFSTCEVYGMTLSRFLKDKDEKGDLDYFLLKEETTPLVLGPVRVQRWIYACAKELLERIIYAYNFEKELDYTIIRPFNFIGPEMDYIPGIEGEGTPRVMACFIGDLLLDRPLQLVDGGESKRTITYIEDAVDAIELMIKKPEKAKGQIFNVGNPHNETTIKNLAQQMITMYKEVYPQGKDSSFRTENVSSKEFYGEGYQDSDRRVGDFSKVRNLLGWEPRYDLEQTLRETITYYVEKYKLKGVQENAP